MPPEPILDPAQIDVSRVVADREEVRKANPQRFEMEQLDAVVLLDTDNHVIVGYRDVKPDEFWVRGHVPGYPLFPGVLMCEASAQLCGFYITKYKIMKDLDFIGFGGLEN